MRSTFHIVHRLSFVLVLLAGSCAKDNNPVNNPQPPCIYCPVDFALIDFEPAWSPDGRTIAYVHGDREPGKSGIYLINPDGSNKRQFYASPGASAPSWSPDGQWIAFHDQAQVYKIKSNGDSLTQLTFEGRNFFPAWSPDGQWIAYDKSLADASGPAGIWRMKRDGTSKQALFGGAFPAWHPNKNELLGVVGTSPTSIWKRFVRYSLFQSRIIDTLAAVAGAGNYYPVYSPDGTKIAFTSQLPNSRPQIWVMRVDGTELRQLTETQGYSCDWSPDGEWLVYTDSRASNGRLWVMRKDGTMKRQLTFNN